MFPLRENGPPSRAFTPAKWRGVTGPSIKTGDEIGLSFDLEDGSVCRLLISSETAITVANVLLECIERYRNRMNVHSDNSSGSPNRDGSPQEGQ